MKFFRSHIKYISQSQSTLPFDCYLCTQLLNSYHSMAWIVHLSNANRRYECLLGSWIYQLIIHQTFILYPHEISKPNMIISARVGMNLTSLLTLIAMFDGVRSEVPKVSYISFMDIWMTVCVIIIFFAIVEYAVSHSLLRHKKKSTAILVDKVSRYAMMILFILFNAGYWPVLLDRCNFCKTDSRKGS